MVIFSELEQHMAALRDVLGEGAQELSAAVAALGDDEVAQVIAQAGALARAAEKVGIVASGVAARRSTREAGHSGLAQKRGHRNTVSLVQDLTGSTRADAAKAVRLGESLLDATAPTPTTPQPGDDGATIEPAAEPWHAPLARALMTGTVSSAQHDAILRGLGEPPCVDPDAIACMCGGDACTCVADATAAVHEAWSLAGDQLIEEAAHRTVEELRRTARAVRDRLDPEGAEQRYLARYQARSFRLWTDQDGCHRGTFVFDDEGAAWVRAITDAAMRPRRGGPRFVDAEEKRRADALADDPRTNDQLLYDLVLDVLRAGSLADAETVFGTRQAGVRVVTVVDTASSAQTDAGGNAVGEARGVAHLEDTGDVIPAWSAAQHNCTAGHTEVTLDQAGNPLYLGREARLFSPKQRLALALRDGGCRWKGCDRPAHYCESHHIDHYAQDEGRTDIDRGILLCRFHHMNLHHGGWRITRDGHGEFLLHPPDGAPALALKPRLNLQYAWAGIDPPPRRFRPAAA